MPEVQPEAPVLEIPVNSAVPQKQKTLGKLGILGMFGVLGVLVITGAVYAGIQIGKRQNMPSVDLSSKVPSGFPTQSPTNIPTLDPIANWRVYTNTDNGFEFKYPNYGEWNVETFPLSPPGAWAFSLATIYNYKVSSFPGKSYSPSDEDLFKIDIGYDKSKFSVDDWFANQKQQKDVNDNPTQYFNVKNISVSSQKGIYYETKDIFTELTLGTAVFETPCKKIIIFAGGLNFPANKNTFDQILASFRFIK